MSKSKSNVVDPTDIVDQYGADTVRWFMISDSPPDRDLLWTDAGIGGAWRFVQKIWRLAEDSRADTEKAPKKRPKTLTDAEEALFRLAHQSIDGVAKDIETFHYNKAVARIYAFANALAAADGALRKTWAFREALHIFVQLIGPMMPHLAEEIWHALGHEGLLADAPWPEAEPKYLEAPSVTIAVQVMGKLRDTLEAPAGAAKEDLERDALKSEKVQRAIAGKEIKKVIVVPDRIVNIVIG